MILFKRITPIQMHKIVVVETVLVAVTVLIPDYASLLTALPMMKEFVFSLVAAITMADHLVAEALLLAVTDNKTINVLSLSHYNKSKRAASY